MIEKIGPSLFSVSLIRVLFILFSIFTPGPPLNDNSYNSNGYSLPRFINERAASPTCGPPEPPTPPFVPTPKLNLYVVLHFPDAVCNKEVSTLFEAD